MTQHINVNGHVLAFPDGMSDADMTAAIKRNGLEFVKPAQSMTDKALELGKDALGGVGNLVYGALKGAADPIYGATQAALHGANSAYQVLAPNTLSGAVSGKPNNAMQRLTDNYDALLKNTESTYQSDTDGSVMAGLGRFGANMATPIKGARGLTGLPAIVNGIKTGLGLSAVQPVFNTDDGYAGAKGKQVAVGATVGGVLPVLGNAAGAVWNGIRPAIMPQRTVGDNILRATQADAGLGSAAAPKLPLGQQILQDIKTGLTGKPPEAAPALTDSGMAIGSLNGSRNVQEVLDRITNRPTFVAGSKPTTAQVVNTPELSMAEKVLMNNPAYRTSMENQSNVNNAARINQISQVAKTPEELAAAIKARGEATQPLYDQAFANPYPITPELQSILDRPSAKAAIANGKVIAGEGNKTLNITPGSPAQAAPTGLLDAAGAPLTKEVPASDGMIDGQTLQYLKLGINNVIPDGRPNGIAGLSADAVKKTSGDLHNWLLENAPQYKAADSAYAELSKPINDMRVGQAVKDVLGTSRPSDQLATTADELAQKRLAQTSSGDSSLTLNNVHSAIKTALNDEGQYGITPEAASALDGVKADLQRQSSGGASIRSNGSDSAYNLQAPNWLSGKIFGGDLSGTGNAMPAVVGGVSLLGDMLGGAGMINSLGLGGMAAAGAKKAGAFVGNRVNTVFQNAMSDPDYYAQLLRNSLGTGSGLLDSVAPTVSQGLSVGGLLNTR